MTTGHGRVTNTEALNELCGAQGNLRTVLHVQRMNGRGEKIMQRIWIVTHREPFEQPTTLGAFSTPELAANGIVEDLMRGGRHVEEYSTEEAWLDGPTG